MPDVSESTGETTPAAEPRGIPEPVSWLVDYLVPVVLVLIGAAVAFGGTAVFLGTDRTLVVDLVEEGAIQSDFLSQADLVDVSIALLQWTGAGLVVIGIGSIIAGLGFVGYRRRVRNRPADSQFGTYAVLGALVTVFTSFVPFSTLLGGGVAGYLWRRTDGSATKVGAISGLLALLPAAVLVLFVFGGLSAGALAIGEGTGALLAVGLGVFLVVFLAALSAALGGLGGYVGGRLADDTDRRPRESPSQP